MAQTFAQYAAAKGNKKADTSITNKVIDATVNVIHAPIVRVAAHYEVKTTTWNDDVARAAEEIFAARK